MVRRAAFALVIALTVGSGARASADVGEAAPRAIGGEFDCADIWRGDVEERVLPGRCDQLASVDLGGGRTAAISVPLTGMTAAQRDRYVSALSEALPRAWATYGAFGPMPHADIVFDPRGDGTKSAESGFSAADETCVTFVYPRALRDRPERTRFIVAHEAFHCFQRFALDSGRVTGSSAAWWKEGSAEHFANVVYPDANVEWEGLRELRGAEPDLALLDLSYAAFPFFQHTANTQGDAQVIALLRHLADGGDPADWPGMPALFHGFAEAFLTDAIVDASGVVIPIRARAENQGRLRPERAGRVFQVRPRPFVIERALVEWAEASVFDVQTELVGEVINSSQEHPEGSWGALPDPVVTCDGPTINRILTTAVRPRAGRYRLDVIDVADRERGAPCCPGGSEPCVVVHGAVEATFVGGVCWVEGGFLMVAVGYGVFGTTAEQDGPFPRGDMLVLARATPGSEPAGFPNVSISNGVELQPYGSNASIVKAADLLTGTFSSNDVTGEYYCPALTPADVVRASPR